MRVSMGVFPTNRTKKSCSMTEDETVRSEGKRRRSFPNLLGWLGYWLLTYSSRAHWDFSWRPSTWTMSDKPQASAEESKKGPEVHPVVKRKRLTSQHESIREAGVLYKFRLQKLQFFIDTISYQGIGRIGKMADFSKSPFYHKQISRYTQHPDVNMNWQ